MGDVVVVTLITALVFFILGILFHKYGLSEVTAIKDAAIKDVAAIKSHVTAELSTLRAELVGAIQEEVKKVSARL
jgi:hypothetical protein